MRKRIEKWLNHYSVRKKLIIVYIVCVVLPLIITDSIVATLFFRAEERKTEYEMKNIASAVKYDMEFAFGEAQRMTAAVYINKYLSDFLNKQYDSNLDFVSARHILTKNSVYENSYGFSDSNMVIYADNPSLVDGGYFKKINEIRTEPWYVNFQKSGRALQLQFYYDGKERKVSLIRKLNYFQDSDSEKLVKLDLGYNALLRNITKTEYSMPVYICDEGRILFSNAGSSQYTRNFEPYIRPKNTAYVETLSLYGNNIKIMVVREKNIAFQNVKNALPWTLLLLMFNILIPMLVMNIINHSFTDRLAQLSEVFDQTKIDQLAEIEDIKGQDEIAMLMSNYNRMVQRFNELIRSIYLGRLERQELDIARQKAELLALRSQINPHFLSNVLESIRMHCVIRNEKETALMIEQLALLERQNANWSKDFVMIQEEIQLIKTYLELQKYRFGNRLSYDVELESDCETYLIPKLTIVTFVENACVHGVEGKMTPSWIYVRVYTKDEQLVIEIEDTGTGISREQTDNLMERIENATIDILRKDSHIGIVNACLRLKLAVDEDIGIELESEEGMGTFFMIRIPLVSLKKSHGGE
ncbi:MAG: histidine kinase [Eubacteriales bacterium]|nr:histidine kinase [Eubacteriales bacterium]